MTRTPLGFASLTAALTVGVGIWYAEPRPARLVGDGPGGNAATRPSSKAGDHWQAYLAGHDWVETSQPTDARTGLAVGSKGLLTPPDAVDCTQTDCRVCRWDRLFGGEW